MSMTIFNDLLINRTPPPFSSTLKALLVFSKQPDLEFNYESVKQCLVPLYHEEMKLLDVLQILYSAYVEMITQPKFGCNKLAGVQKIIFGPIHGSNCLGNNGIFGPSAEDKFTVAEFYDKMIYQVINQFRFSKIDWCSEYLYLNK